MCVRVREFESGVQCWSRVHKRSTKEGGHVTTNVLGGGTLLTVGTFLPDVCLLITLLYLLRALRVRPPRPRGVILISMIELLLSPPEFP